MWFRLSFIMLTVALQTSFPGNNPDAIRQRYGKPLSESFLVRPDVVVSAIYGPSGNTCELAITPKQSDVIFTMPGSSTMDDKILAEITEELAPKSERGKFITSEFLNIICLPDNNCVGTRESWENLSIYRNSGETGTRYEIIRWKRSECGEKIWTQPH